MVPYNSPWISECCNCGGDCPPRRQNQAAMKRFLTRLVTVVVLAASIFGCERPAMSGTERSSANTQSTSTAQSASESPEDAAPAGIVAEEPSPARPVAFGAAVRPAKVRPGETLILFVQACIAPTWHIYSAEDPAGEAIPTTLKLKLPQGVERSDPGSIHRPNLPAMASLLTTRAPSLSANDSGWRTARASACSR